MVREYTNKDYVYFQHAIIHPTIKKLSLTMSVCKVPNASHKCSELNWIYEEAEVLEMRERYSVILRAISRGVELMQGITGYLYISTTAIKN